LRAAMLPPYLAFYFILKAGRGVCGRVLPLD